MVEGGDASAVSYKEMGFSSDDINSSKTPSTVFMK